MVQIKCHKCGRMHRKHTATELKYDELAGKYYTLHGNSGGIKLPIVWVGSTCFAKMLKSIL